ncbi:MAG: energy transducer TonB [Balneolaceae bacterium]|nr:energy transducer TonB [Balneolaceae bacterium]
MRPFKKNSADLRKYYTVVLETGIILSLLIFLGLTQLPISKAQKDVNLVNEQDVVQMDEVEQTVQEERPPAPPRPPVPVEVPNETIIQDEILNIDAELNLNERIDIPKPPPQEESGGEEEEDFFVVVEQMPELIGGIAALQQKIRYPERARRAGIEGRVIIQFIVDENGEVVNPRVVRGIGGGCDEEALRVVNQARFNPGRQRGEPVRVQYSLPVVFRLKNNF